MIFRKQHPCLFWLLCIFGSFALLLSITFGCMWLDWGIPLAVLWSAAGLCFYFLPTFAMLRWFLRSLRILRRGTSVDAVCIANYSNSRSEHCLVTWEDADGSHSEDLGYATLRVRRPPYPVKLYCFAGQYSLGMESAISSGISALLFLLVQSTVLIPIISAMQH